MAVIDVLLEGWGHRVPECVNPVCRLRSTVITALKIVLKSGISSAKQITFANSGTLYISSVAYCIAT